MSKTELSAPGGGMALLILIPAWAFFLVVSFVVSVILALISALAANHKEEATAPVRFGMGRVILYSVLGTFVLFVGFLYLAAWMN